MEISWEKFFCQHRDLNPVPHNSCLLARALPSSHVLHLSDWLLGPNWLSVLAGTSELSLKQLMWILLYRDHFQHLILFISGLAGSDGRSQVVVWRQPRHGRGHPRLQGDLAQVLPSLRAAEAAGAVRGCGRRPIGVGGNWVKFAVSGGSPPFKVRVAGELNSSEVAYLLLTQQPRFDSCHSQEFSLDVAEIYWRHCLEQWREAW